MSGIAAAAGVNGGGVTPVNGDVKARLAARNDGATKAEDVIDKHRKVNINNNKIKGYLKGQPATANKINSRLSKDGYKKANNTHGNFSPNSVNNTNINTDKLNANIKNRVNKFFEGKVTNGSPQINLNSFNNAITATQNTKITAKTLKSKFTATGSVIKEYRTIKEDLFKQLDEAWDAMTNVFDSEVFSSTFKENTYANVNGAPHNGFFTRKIGNYKSGGVNVSNSTSANTIRTKLKNVKIFMSDSNNENKKLVRIEIIKKIFMITKDILLKYKNYLNKTKNNSIKVKKLLVAGKRLQNAINEKKVKGAAKAKSAAEFNIVVLNLVNALTNIDKRIRNNKEIMNAQTKAQAEPQASN